MSKKSSKDNDDLAEFLRRQPAGRVCKTPEDLLDCVSELGVGGPPAEWLQKEIDDAVSSLKRDEQRQAGLRKPRPSMRKDELQAWINKSVVQCPDLTAEERYNSAPEWVQEEVKLGRFSKRVATAKKLASSAK